MLFREKQQILIFVTAALIIGGFVLFRHLPLREKIEAVDRTKAAQTVAVTKALTEIGQLPSLKEQLSELEVAVGNYDARVPPRRELGVFLQQIADLMNEHNLAGQLVQPGKELEKEGVFCIPVDLQCKGRLSQIFGFFRSLQSLDRLVRIEQVKLENDRDFTGDVSVQAKTVIYYGMQAQNG
ncbi:MAG: type IV pilus inner membrane component PilO [Planctomycetota bacterium]|jgi:Tfp pilus assembly protein PilO